MAFHIVMNRPSRLDEVARDAKKGLNPRHSMVELAIALDATVYDGTDLTPSPIDHLLAKASRTDPLWWAMARGLRDKVAPGDVVFCTGEDVGLPVAMLCGGSVGARVAMMAHSIDSLKKRVALRIFGAKRKVSLFTTVCEHQAHVLRRHVGSADRVSFLWDQTDTQFFAPGPASHEKRRPIVMSVGLEQRDYSTLAVATSGLDVDVCISGYSADTRVLARAFPEVLPANMTRRFYPWRDLVQLYRDADVVVVSLFPNNYAAGVQGLMEGLSCGRPVVVTSTAGLEGYLQPDAAMRVIAAGDADEMKRAIVDLLGDRAKRKHLSLNARALAHSRHSCEAYVEALVQKLRELHAKPAS